MSDLSDKLAEFQKKATELEVTRAKLEAELFRVMLDEIIPKVDSALPEHYSIDAERSKVIMVTNEGEVAYEVIKPKFEVHLQLLYDQKPICLGNDQIIYTARDIVSQPLQDLANKYGLNEISLWGRSIEG